MDTVMALMGMAEAEAEVCAIEGAEDVEAFRCYQNRRNSAHQSGRSQIGREVRYHPMVTTTHCIIALPVTLHAVD